MIKFKCNNCNHQIGAPEKHAGKRVRCPKCKATIRVPESVGKTGTQEPELIKFRCPSCSQKIGIAPDYAGKRVRCAKCKSSLIIPQTSSQSGNLTAKDQTEVLRAGQEDKSASDELWADIGALEALQQAEVSAEAVELPQKKDDDDGYKIAAAAPHKAPPRDEFSDFQRPSSSYSTKPKSSKMTGYTVGAVGGILTLTVIWLIFSAYKGVNSFVETDEEHLEPAKKVAEQFIDALQEERFDDAKQLFTVESQAKIQSEQLTAFSEQMGKPKEKNYNNPLFQQDDKKGKTLLFCSLTYENNTEKTSFDMQNITFLVLEEYGEYKIDSASIYQFSPNRNVSLGTYSNEELEEMSLEEVRGILTIITKYMCAFALIILALIVIQIVSWWVVFDKAGQPGWAAIIPFYNMWILAKTGDQSGWTGLAVCFSGGLSRFVPIPYVELIIPNIFLLIICLGIAKNFNHSIFFGIGLTVLPATFFPILAFSGD